MREEFVRGTFSIIKERFAFVDTEEGEGIFIPKTAFHGALDGDVVLVRITKDKTEEHGREGEVTEIVSREKEKIVGILERRSDFGFVRPTHAFGKDIYIPRGKMKKAQNGELVVVSIYFLGDKDRKPEGEIIEVLGDPYNTKNMVDALIYREGMSEEFPRKVKTELKNIRTTISEKEVSSRHDLREYSIITIDGEDARDLDDAVYVEKMKNGNYKLLVCIADVSYYIPENSELDLEAQKRGVAAVRAGITGKELDAVCRDYIREQGYTKEFNHGTGHGVGLEIHEEPVANPKSDTVFSENMIITVEPGIYLSGEIGLRIEDSVIVKADGCELLTHSPKELIEIGI